MKVLHITPSFFPATYWGGPIFSTLGLCDSLARNTKVKLRVLTTDSSGPSTNDRLELDEIVNHFPEGYDVYYFRKSFGAEISLSFFKNLVAMIKWADIVHLTYAYSAATIPTLLLCRIFNKPIVWSPRGALQRWSGTRKPVIKKIWEKLCNTLIVEGMASLHVTSNQEAIDSAKRIPKPKISFIPNGVEIPKKLNSRAWKPDNTLRIMYLGRLNPIKGIENLIKAFEQLNLNENKRLYIYGDGEKNYKLSLKNLTQSLEISDQITFCGPVSGSEKYDAFMNSDICIIPSFSENFGMVIAEALAHGVPVIASKGTPWKDLKRKNCGLWVENNPEDLALAIKELSNRNLKEMGENGRKWIKGEFTWERIGQQMYQVYLEFL